jgi:hypothetical protein
MLRRGGLGAVQPYAPRASVSARHVIDSRGNVKAHASESAEAQIWSHTPQPWDHPSLQTRPKSNQKGGAMEKGKSLKKPAANKAKVSKVKSPKPAKTAHRSKG